MHARIFLSLTLFLASPTGSSPAQPTSHGARTARDIAQDWRIRHRHHGLLHSCSNSSPTDSPNIYAESFVTDDWSFREAWNFYAGKCGIGRKYAAKTISNVAGAGTSGSWLLVEALVEGKRSASVFTSRRSGYTVSITLIPPSDGKTVQGTLVVSLN